MFCLLNLSLLLQGCSHAPYLSTEQRDNFEKLSSLVVDEISKERAKSPFSGFLLVLRIVPSDRVAVVADREYGETMLHAGIGLVNRNLSPCGEIDSGEVVVYAFPANTPLPPIYRQCRQFFLEVQHFVETRNVVSELQTSLSRADSAIESGKLDSLKMFSSLSSRIDRNWDLDKQQNDSINLAIEFSKDNSEKLFGFNTDLEKNADNLTSLAKVVDSLSSQFKSNDDEILKVLNRINAEVKDIGGRLK